MLRRIQLQISVLKLAGPLLIGEARAGDGNVMANSGQNGSNPQRGDSTRPVIQLDDLTVGPAVEINRLESKLITALEEMSQLRKEHVELVSDQQKLKLEFTELKLALAAIAAKSSSP